MHYLRRSALMLFVALLAGCQTMGSGGSAPSGSGTVGSSTASSGAAGGGAPSAGSGGDARAAVTELLERHRKALLEKDVATIDRLWADDLSFINHRGQILTKAQRMENVRTGATSFKSIQITDQVVRPYGDAVVTTGVVTLDGQYSGEEGSGDYRFTTVWSRRGPQWQMVALQMTKIEK